MGNRVQIVSYPDIENRSVQFEHLWLLVGGEDYFNGSRAFHLGPDRDIEGDDLAGRRLRIAIEAAEAEGMFVNSEEAFEALVNYRQARKQIA